jgi:hypothetical protein
LGSALAPCFVACNLILGIQSGTPQGSGGHGGAGGPSTTSSSTSAASSGMLDAGDGGGDASPVSLDGLVLLMHLDETSWTGTGVVTDGSGKGNNGTVVGHITSAPGKFGGAAFFDGYSYIDVPDSPTLAPTDQLTVAAWIYPTMQLGGGGGIITKRVGYGYPITFTMFLWYTGTDSFLYTDLPGRLYSMMPLDALNAWYHVAVVFDGTQVDPTQRVSFYINGNLDSTQQACNTTLDPTSADVQIGNLPEGGTPFIGRIDEAAVWVRALSGMEIQALFKATGPL